MVDINRGLKAGLAGGILIGILMALFFFFNLPTDINPYGKIFYLLSLLLTAAFYGIIGLLAGMVFAVLYEKIPVKGSLLKGAVFSVPFVLVLILVFPPIFTFYSIITTMLVIVWGSMLGFFYDKFGPKKARSKKK